MTASRSPLDPRQSFQILALDGGGIKGIFSAAVLAAIEEDLKVHIVDHFDLIAGTSTGGIIAIGLGLGLTPRQILDFYLEEGGSIFANNFRLASFCQIVRRKFSSSPFIASLKRHFGDKRFGDSTKRLIIPCYNLGEDDVYIFRTAHHISLKRDYKVPAWKVALSTSSAPTYFPAAREVDKIRLIDGGVWANNPSMVAIAEAYGVLELPLSCLRVLNLGTCNEVPHRPGSLDSGGYWQWRTAAIDVVLRGQSIAAANQARFLVGKDSFLRVDPSVPPGILKLDSTMRGDDLVGKASHHSRVQMNNIERLFFAHKAAPFTQVFG